MLSFGNKEFRNLQEQVLKNMNDIQDLSTITGVLKYKGIVDAYEDLPQDAAEGDAYLVGIVEPYTLYAKDAVKFRLLGRFPAEGPQGPQGIQGVKGDRGVMGSKIYTGSEEPSVAAADGDMYIRSSGEIYTYRDNKWSYFTSVKGPMGPAGARGAKGDTGEQGPQGEVGPKGDTGVAIRIVKKVDNIGELPSPSSVSQGDGYLVGNALYTPINGEWVNVGTIVYPGFGTTTGVAYEGSAGQENRTRIEALEGQSDTYLKKIVDDTEYETTLDIVIAASAKSEFTPDVEYIAKSNSDGQVVLRIDSTKRKVSIVDMDGYIQYAAKTGSKWSIGDRYIELDSAIIQNLFTVNAPITGEFFSRRITDINDEGTILMSVDVTQGLGVVQQITSKNLMRVKSAKNHEVSSTMGQYNTPYTLDAPSRIIRLGSSGFNNSESPDYWIDVKAKHRYLLMVGLTVNSTQDMSQIQMGYNVQSGGGGGMSVRFINNILYGVFTGPSVNTKATLYISTKLSTVNFEAGTKANFAAVVDLTEEFVRTINFDELYQRFAVHAAEYAKGVSIPSNTYIMSALVDTFSAGRMLATTVGTNYIYYNQFGDNDLFIQTDECKFNRISRLNTATKKLMFAIRKPDGSEATEAEKAEWLTTMQAEWGQRTEVEEYTIPVPYKIESTAQGIIPYVSIPLIPKLYFQDFKIIGNINFENSKAVWKNYTLSATVDQLETNYYSLEEWVVELEDDLIVLEEKCQTVDININESQTTQLLTAGEVEIDIEEQQYTLLRHGGIKNVRISGYLQQIIVELASTYATADFRMYSLTITAGANIAVSAKVSDDAPNKLHIYYRGA